VLLYPHIALPAGTVHCEAAPWQNSALTIDRDIVEKKRTPFAFVKRTIGFACENEWMIARKRVNHIST
jgi:hypothetical protein